ncbi:MAG: hypothetical protein HY886_01330 [Deltaproteobacteria bacterium]|nr:hypothetical protein [Deltaproteobacteria bacterium]
MVYATNGAFPYSKHGGGTTDGETPCAGGVNRGLGTDYGGNCTNAVYYNDPDAGKYVSGECNHCHEPHASFGGAEPSPSSSGDAGPDPYLVFKQYGTSAGYSELCWYCHENISNINGSGSQPTMGRWGFYQGKAIYQASSHYSPPAGEFYWPGDGSGSPIWPRTNRNGLPTGNKGSCLNCHTPHGIRALDAPSAYDAASPDGTGGVPASMQTVASGNPSVNADYLIPRQLIAWEETLCERCHDSSGPSTRDIQTEINKRGAGPFSGSGHPVDDTTLAGRHVASEAVPVTTKHVECYDCHNPHAAKAPTNVQGDGDGGRVKGMKYVDIDGITRDPAVADRQPYVYEICLKCHGNTFATFIPADKYASAYNQPTLPLRATSGSPASSYTYGSNKRLEFNASSVGTQTACGSYPASDCNPSLSQNMAYHPVSQAGRNATAAISLGLLAGLSSASTIHCTDCHNNDATAATSGPVTGSNIRVTDRPSSYVGLSPVGPHGSSPAPVSGYYTARLLRANYNTTLGIWNGTYWDKPFSTFDSNNFALCFLCHDQDAFTCQPATEACNWTSGPKTNFYSAAYDINLHASHLAGKPGLSAAGTFTTCANCHYNVHSNVEAANTMYEDSNDATWNRSTDGARLVNFSPIVGPSTWWNYSRPFWGCVYWFSQRKGCDFNCHGFDQELFYAPPDMSGCQ